MRAAVLGLCLVGCQSSGSWVGEVLVSDGSGEQWFTGDLSTGRVEQAVDLNRSHPSDCDQDNPELWCMTFQSRYRIDHRGRPEVLYAYNPVQQRASQGFSDTTLVGVGAEDLQEHWRIEALDFSQNFSSDQYCWWDPEDPCSPHPEGDEVNNWTCRLYEAHDMVVVEQDEEGLRLWVADSRNARLIKIRASYGDRCAVVEDVVNAALLDWDIYITPNSLQWWVEDGEEHLLATMKSSFEEADFTQEGGDARGKVVELVRREGEWEQRWEHPPESAIEASFVNAPHGVERVLGETGTEYVLFAHSLGLGEDFGEGSGGSIGVLRIEGDSATYLYDAVIEGDLPFQYTRDITALPDGMFLAADSGCTSGLDCPHPTGLYVLELPLDSAVASELDGVYTPDHDRLDTRTVEVLAGPFFDSASMIYSAELLP